MQNLHEEEPQAVHCLAYDEQEDLMYTGDERGMITCYEFAEIIAKVELQDPALKQMQYQ